MSEEFPRLSGQGPKPLPDPRDEAIAKFRKVIQDKIAKITKVPNDPTPVNVKVKKKSKRPRFNDNDVERAKEKIVQFARNQKPTLFEVIRKMLNEPAEGEGDLTNMEMLARCYIEQMKKPGSFQFFKEIIDREMGKVPDKIQNEITIVQPNLPMIIDDFHRIASSVEDNPEDPQAGRN